MHYHGSMRFLVIQPDLNSPGGVVEERMRAHGHEPVTVRPMHGAALPSSPDGYAGALVLGGPMSANDDEQYPALAPMRDLLRQFHAADKPLLGICLGAQIFARCFGEEVRRHTTFEFGYTPLQFTDGGRDDPLLSGLPDPQWIMQFHEDTFDVPADGTKLMTGTVCANQAFRMGRATYGFQCHFEATPGLIQHWVDISAPSLERRLGGRATATLTQLQRDHQARAARQRAFAEAVSDRWLSLAS